MPMTRSDLEEIRRREMKYVDTQKAMVSLGDAFESAVLHQPLAVTSGMVEMQRLFNGLVHGVIDQNRG